MLKRFRGFVKSRPFLHKISILLSGALLGQAIVVGSLPLLTRLYTPESFGLLGVYLSFATIMSVGACLRFDLAIPLPPQPDDAASLAALGLLAATGFSGTLLLIVLVFPTEIVALIDQPVLAPYLWSLPVGSWVLALYSLTQFWSIRMHRYGDVSASQVSRALACTGAQIAFGLVHPIALGLVLGQILYAGVGAFLLGLRGWIADRAVLDAVTWAKMRRNFVDYRRFPLYSVPESVLDTAANNLPLALIAAHSGAQEAGFLLLAQRVVAIPVGLLGGNISRVYLAHATQKRLEGQLGAFTVEIMLNLFKLGVIPFLLLAGLGPWLFSFAFGASWQRAGWMLAVMAPFMLMQFVVSPVSTILHATRNQRAAFLLQLFGFVVILGAMEIMQPLGWLDAFSTYVAASTVYYLAYVCVVLRIARNN